jgi:hypothetical protein
MHKKQWKQKVTMQKEKDKMDAHNKRSSKRKRKPKDSLNLAK